MPNTANFNTTTISDTGAVSITNSTASSSTSTGALIVAGGIGAGGALNVGGNLDVGGTLTGSRILNDVTVNSISGLIETMGLWSDGTDANGATYAVQTIGSLSDFTFWMYYRTPSLDQGGGEVVLVRSSIPSVCYVSITSSGQLKIYAGTGSPYYSAYSPAAANTPGILVVRRSGGYISFIHNGITDASNLNWVGMQINGLNQFFPGQQGFYSKCGLSNYGMTEAEIRSLISRGLTTLPEQRGGSVIALNTSAWTTPVGDAFTTFTGASATGFTAAKSSVSGRAVSTAFTGFKGKQYKFTFTASISSGSQQIVLADSSLSGFMSLPVTITAGSNTIILTATSNSATGLYVVQFSPVSGNPNFSISLFNGVPLGTVYELGDASLGFDNIIPDTSNNNNHTYIPSSGVKRVKPNFTSQFTIPTIYTTSQTLTSEYLVIMNSSTARTLTLPSAVGISGRTYVLKNKGTAILTVDGTSSGLIDGFNTVSVVQYSSITLVSDGTTWNAV